ncbi:6-bladed beta-propeller [candidate division KSB1 bacterium]|nr:6-bladed beta-propeller [candidate division KSB1 bacterium]
MQNRQYIPIIIILLVSLLVLFLINSCNKSEQKISKKFDMIKLNDIVLKESNNMLIGECKKIHIDKNDKLYYADKSQQQIIIFDRLGNIIKKIGRYGDGPEDLSNIVDFDVIDENIFIFHKGGLRVSTFKNSGELINTFTFDLENNILPYGSALVANKMSQIIITERTYKGNMDNFSLEKFITNTYLLGKYDIYGKPLGKIGNYSSRIINSKKFAPVFIKMPLFCIDSKDNIFLISSCKLPIVQKFDKDGFFIREIDLQSSLFKSVFDMADMEQSYLSSFFYYIKYIEKKHKIFALFGNREKEPDQTNKKSLSFFLIVWDEVTNSLSQPIELIQYASKAPKIDVDMNGVIYVLTDDTPENITITKYALACQEK